MRGKDWTQWTAAAKVTRNTKRRPYNSTPGNTQALSLIELAMKTYPEAKEFEKTKVQITRRWIQHLQSDLPSLMLSPEHLRSSRAYLNLDQLRTLDPAIADLKKYWKPVHLPLDVSAQPASAVMAMVSVGASGSQ